MILTCPACGTQYVVKDNAIPEGGRKVRCASCRHSWHQDPPPLELEETLADSPSSAEDHAPVTEEPEYPPPTSGDSDDSNLADSWDDGSAEPGQVAGDDAESWPAKAGGVPHAEDESESAEAASRHPLDEPQEANDPSVDILPPATEIEDEFSPFAARDPAAGKKRGPLTAILLVVVVVAALAALFWFLAPAEWKARVGLDEAAGTPLQLMMTHSDRQALESGNELLAVSGRVINPTSKPQRVPPIQAELKSKTGEVVYRWTIAPPTPNLAPGASAQFNSAEVNVPAGGEELTVSLGSPSS